MRWLPRTLFGRLVLAVAGILIVALAASLALHAHERSELLMQASGMRAAQRVGDIVKLFDSVAAEDRRRIAKVLSEPPLLVTLDGPAVLEASDEEASAARTVLFAAMIRRLIGPERLLRARVTEPSLLGARADDVSAPRGMRRSHPDGAPMWAHGGRWSDRPGVALTAQVQLSNGSWVTVESRQPAHTASWPYRLFWSIAILLLAAVAAALLAVRWAIRPLDTMATAAEELGRNVNRPPLPESGPVEVARAARAFNTMQGRLIEYLRSRTHLLAAMSHDLKTPITRLRLRSELLEDERLRERYSSDLQELESMVAATLDFLRGIDDDEPAQPFDVMAMLESVQADLTETGADVTIEGGTEHPYTGQRRALRRCLANLVDNAIQYGGSAHIVVCDALDELAIAVRDEGPGIAPNEMARVFEPFYRIEGSRSRTTGGTGLGLAIARQIARTHGGDVTLVNRPGGGLEAQLKLPRSARVNASPSGPSLHARPANRHP
jgi:signal transduction histidine kinase